MFKTVTRNDIFEKHPLIKDFIGEIQIKELNNQSDNEYFTDWLKDNVKLFDLMHEDVYCRNSRFFKLEIEKKDLKTFTNEFSKSLKKLLNEIDTEEIILLSKYSRDIFGWKEHPYYKVKKSYKNLTEILGKNSLEEALIFDTKEISKIFEIFFWLERCDPAIPEFIFWFDSKERFCFTLCKHGNIHVTEFTYRKTLKEEILKNCGLVKFHKNCDESFSKTGAILGRMVNL